MLVLLGHVRGQRIGLRRMRLHHQQSGGGEQRGREVHNRHRRGEHGVGRHHEADRGE